MVVQVIIAAIVLLVFHFLWPYILRRGAGYSGSNTKSVIWAFKLVNVKGKKLIDLGCGYGKVLKIAKKMGAYVTGIEIDPIRWFISLIRCRCKVLFGDMFRIDLSGYDVIYLFQWPSVNKKLARKFKKELRKGTYVISYMWEVPGLELVTYNKKLDIYIYRI